MRTDQLWLKQIVKFGMLVMMGVSMSACGSGSEKWKEEVQLSDGRIIVIARETIHERGGDEWASNRSGSKPKERRIRFAHPDRAEQMIEWHSTKLDSQTWPEKPLILDVAAEQPIVYSLVSISSGCEIYSKYVYRSDAWVEEPLPEKFELRITNLFIRDGVDMPSFVNIETKRNANSSFDYRRSLKQVGPTRKVCG